MSNLRPYQEQAIANIHDNLKQGVNKQLLVLATGLGKTKTAVTLVERLGFKRVLWITHTEELVEQSALAFIKDKFDNNFAEYVEEIGFINWVMGAKGVFGINEPQFKMGIIKASDFYIDADVTIASAQTLYRRLDKVPDDYFDCVITDESHLFMAKTYVQPLNYFKPKLLLGLTATPHRMDGLSLGDVYDKIVFEYNIGEGVRDKYLCELDGIRIKTDLSLDNVRTTAGELNSSDLSNEINIPKRNKLIVDSYLKYASDKQGIFFCADVKHALDLSEMFNEYGISSKPVVSDKDITTNRKGVIADYKSGELQVLTNVTILTTGFDHPDTGVIGMASPTKSLTKYLQSIGRGTRLKSNEYVDKYGQVCTILDFVDTSSRHKLINTWTLDSGKATEDKLFLTEAQKKELIEERLRKQAKVDAMYKHDERIILLQLPDIIKFKSDKMKEPATPAQLKWINDLGYDIINNNFTKQMCSDIIGMQPCNQKEIEYLKSKGYDTQFATKGHYSTVYFEHELKGKKWK